MSADFDVDVLIVGGGPVGLTMSVELSRYGNSSLLVERNASTTRHPKMDLTNGRTMELFRRLGLAEEISAAGVPLDSTFDVTWVTDLKPSGHELHRFTYGSTKHEYWRRRTQNDGTLTLEPGIRVSQIVIEPVLRKAAEASDLAEVRFSWKLESFEQDADGVTATIINDETGESQQIRSRFVVGCDGGNSTVRSILGIDSEGFRGATRSYMLHFRSTALDVLQKFGQAWHYQCPWGLIVAQDDASQWTLHVFLDADTDASAIDPRELLVRYMGVDFEFEVLVANPWSGNYLVADAYSSGRVFMAGDACHQFNPTGGYGMNTGIPEASNLAWKLSAALHGWGGKTLLDSYHIERHPVAKISKATSERHLGVRHKISELFAQAGDLSANDDATAALRLRLGRQIADLGNAENEGWGTEQGYRYDGSPIIVPDNGRYPEFEMLTYHPSTSPGSRLPHLFLEDGTAVYDHLGMWFTLLVFDDKDVSAFEGAAAKSGVPLKVVRLDDAKARDLYEYDLLLIRPDQHVAWRGNTLPGDCGAVVDIVRGI